MALLYSIIYRLLWRNFSLICRLLISCLKAINLALIIRNSFVIIWFINNNLIFKIMNKKNISSLDSLIMLVERRPSIISSLQVPIMGSNIQLFMISNLNLKYMKNYYIQSNLQLPFYFCLFLYDLVIIVGYFLPASSSAVIDVD